MARGSGRPCHLIDDALGTVRCLFRRRQRRPCCALRTNRQWLRTPVTEITEVIVTDAHSDCGSRLRPPPQRNGFAKLSGQIDRSSGGLPWRTCLDRTIMRIGSVQSVLPDAPHRQRRPGNDPFWYATTFCPEPVRWCHVGVQAVRRDGFRCGLEVPGVTCRY